MRQQVLILRQRLFGDITIHAIRSNKSSKIQISKEWVQDVNSLIELISTVTSTINDEKQLKAILEYIFDSYECIITIFINRVKTLKNNVNNIQNKIKAYPNDEGLLNALTRQFTEQEVLQDAVYQSINKIIECYSNNVQIIYLFSNTLAREQNSEIFTILSVSQLHQLQNLVLNKMTVHNTFLLMSIFHEFMYLLPIQQSELDYNWLQQIVDGLKSHDIQNAYQEYLQKIDQIIIQNFQAVLSFVKHAITKQYIQKILESLNQLNDQNVIDYKSNKVYCETIFVVNILNRVLTQQFFSYKKLQNLFQYLDLNTQDIFNIILQHKQLLLSSSSIYVCLLSEDAQTTQYQESDDGYETTNVSSLIWTQVKNLTLLYFGNKEPTVDQWIQFLEKFSFQSVHVNYNQLVQKIFLHQSTVSHNKKIYEYLSSEKTLDAVTHLRKGGVFPLLLRGLSYDHELALSILRIDLFRLSETKLIHKQTKLVLSIKALLEAAGQRWDNETLLNCGIRLCYTIESGDYEIVSVIYSCLSVLLSVIVLRNKTQRFVITQLLASEKVQEKFLQQFATLLSKAASAAQDVAIAEFMSVIHCSEAVIASDLSKMLSQYGENTTVNEQTPINVNIILYSIIDKLQKYNYNIFVAQIFVRCLFIFFGRGENAAEALRALYEHKRISVVQLAYALRLLMRGHETFKPMRGHPTFDETPLITRPEKHFNAKSVSYFLENLKKFGQTSVMVQYAINELTEITNRFK